MVYFMSYGISAHPGYLILSSHFSEDIFQIICVTTTSPLNYESQSCYSTAMQDEQQLKNNGGRDTVVVLKVPYAL